MAIDDCGKSHYIPTMSPVAVKSPKARREFLILRDYDAAVDAKNRISLRGTRTKYFHVKKLANGSFVLEPRLLVSPDAIPVSTLKRLDTAVIQLKKGQASAPIDLSPFREE